MAVEGSMDLPGVAADARDRGLEGTVWSLDGGDPSANLVRFAVGGGVGEHVNDEVDVLVVGVAGTGMVGVDGEEHALSAGVLVFVPKVTRRWIRSASDDFAYLSVHRRRGGLRVGRRGQRSGEEVGK